jgi:hypothetical protein
MKRFYFLLAYLFLGFFHSGFSQNLNESTDTIYSFPFSTESKLLVFKGQMNGVDTDFAFDTGASIGLANSSSEPSGKLKVKGKQIKMRDANNQVKRVKTGVSDEIQIGGFTFSKVRSLVNDMTYLYCMDYYLLGADVIRQLNWEIDFEKKIIQVSKKPFLISESLFRLPVTYINNRPFVSTGFANEKFNRVLIDFGYTQVMDFPHDTPAIQSFLAKKDSLGLSNPNISSSMGALGLKTYETKTILVDSLLIGDRYFFRIPVDFEEAKGSKIGLGFFSNLSKRTILNNYYLAYPAEVKAIIFSSPLFSTSIWMTDADSLIATMPDTIQQSIRYHESIGEYDNPEYKAATELYYAQFVTRKNNPRVDRSEMKLADGSNVYGYMWGPSEFTSTGTLRDFDRLDELNGIAVPTLLVCGEFDEASPRTVQGYSRMIPKSRFEMIPDAAHSTLNDNPQKMLQVLGNFLKSVKN